jgi:hypothetical protein
VCHARRAESQGARVVPLRSTCACYHQRSQPVAQALRQVRIRWSEDRRLSAPRNFRSMRTRTCLVDPCRRAAGWRSARCALAWPCVCWPSRSPLARGEAMGPAGLLLRYRRVAVPRPTREAFRCGLTKHVNTGGSYAVNCFLVAICILPLAAERRPCRALRRGAKPPRLIRAQASLSSQSQFHNDDRIETHGEDRRTPSAMAGATMIKTDRVKANLLCDMPVKQARPGR